MKLTPLMQSFVFHSDEMGYRMRDEMQSLEKGKTVNLLNIGSKIYNLYKVKVISGGEKTKIIGEGNYGI